MIVIFGVRLLEVSVEVEILLCVRGGREVVVIAEVHILSKFEYLKLLRILK
jgi:hypothetical protein